MTRADALALVFLAVTVALVAAFGPTPLAIAAPTAALIALLADGVARPASAVLMPVVTRGPRTVAAVALTFDDGPDPVVTPRILDALAAEGASATFFAIGRHLEAYPELARRIAAGGHELANHSYHHSRWLNFRGPTALQAEIERGGQAVQGVAGGHPPLYRPPVGLKNPPLARVAKRLGLTIVAWSLHGRDTGTRTAEAIAERVLTRVRPGDIILLHDGCDRPGVSRAATAEAVPLILRGLRDRGLRPLTLSELLAG